MNTIVTPKEVETYFNSIPVDQIPEIPMEYEYNQIIKTPKISAKKWRVHIIRYLIFVIEL